MVPLKPPDSPGISSTSMASTENERDGGRVEVVEVETGLLPPLDDPAGSILFKKSSTFGTGKLRLLSPLEEARGVDIVCESMLELDLCGFSFRVACAALRANSSCFRCCSIS